MHWAKARLLVGWFKVRARIALRACNEEMDRGGGGEEEVMMRY